jgi:hypothetical protein
MIKLPNANVMSAPAPSCLAGNSSNLATRLCQVCHIFTPDLFWQMLKIGNTAKRTD